MTISGLGQGGYLYFQKETVYNTFVNNSKVFLPVKSGAINYEVERIEVDPFVGTRLNQAPQAGDKKVGPKDLTLYVSGDQFGQLMNICFGASANSGSNAYVHTWLVPITGTTIGGSMSIGQAIGYDNESQFPGVKIIKWELSGQSKKFLEMKLTVVGVDRSNNNASRAATITVTAVNFYRFADCVLQITPSGVSQFTQLMNSFKLGCDLGYLEQGQRFQSGSAVASAPIFGTIPQVSFECNIDSEWRYEDWASSYKNFKLDLALTSTSFCYQTTPYSAAFEIPVGKLDPKTLREQVKDNTPLDLKFMLEGGTTTGSSSALVPMEIRCTDATATYP